MKSLTKVLLAFVCFVINVVALAPRAVAQEDLDRSKWKVTAYWWYSTPSGYFNGQGNDGHFDINRDFGFGNYSTFSGSLDYRFKRKHHLLFSVTPLFSSQTTTLARTIVFQGQTFDVGAQVKSEVRSIAIAPGYQWDFIRRRSGYLALQVNVFLMDTQAKLSAAASVTGGGGSLSGSREASGSVFAPLPAIGPKFQIYPIPNSNRFYVDGALTGMYFFGYGDFVSANATLGFTLSRHWDLQAGYLVGSRLRINGSSNDIGIRLTQKGLAVGVEYHWGQR